MGNPFLEVSRGRAGARRRVESGAGPTGPRGMTLARIDGSVKACGTLRSMTKTAAATAAWMRKAEDRRADELRERGWTCIPPDGEAGARAARHVLGCSRCVTSARECLLETGPQRVTFGDGSGVRR